MQPNSNRTRLAILEGAKLLQAQGSRPLSPPCLQSCGRRKASPRPSCRANKLTTLVQSASRRQFWNAPLTKHSSRMQAFTKTQQVHAAIDHVSRGANTDIGIFTKPPKVMQHVQSFATCTMRFFVNRYNDLYAVMNSGGVQPATKRMVALRINQINFNQSLLVNRIFAHI